MSAHNSEVSPCQKILWDLLSPKEIKEELCKESQSKSCMGRRSSICTESPLRTIYAESPLANYFITDHFFQNPLEKYYRSPGVDFLNYQDKDIEFDRNSVLDLLKSEMEHFGSESSDSKSNSGEEDDLSSNFSDGTEEPAVNEAFCESECRSGNSSPEEKKSCGNDTIEEVEQLLKAHSLLSSTRKSIQCQNNESVAFSEPSSIRRDLQCTIRENSMRNEKETTRSRLRKIRSPVSVYIKNPSTLPQIQHVSVNPNPLIKRRLFEKTSGKVVLKSSNKENVNFNFNLPPRLYKPAKHKIVSKQSTVKLPNNIQKRIPTAPKVIKHSRRITKRNICGTSLEIELLKENLTNIYDTSALNSTASSVQEISLLSTKEEYIK